MLSSSLKWKLASHENYFQTLKGKIVVEFDCTLEYNNYNVYVTEIKTKYK